MTKFERIGIERQNNAPDRAAAVREFELSCSICIHHGHAESDCDHCLIAGAHAYMMSMLADIEEYEARQKANKPQC